ncbi:transposase [Spiroplasma ixodetis]|uniref:Mutator family transposase n=1 Tax=Spiroplasma ixodetis TaxID=2141 RepID=A0ABM8JPW8_9MOLU
MQVLESFESKWNKQYPQIAKSWYKNWDNLMVFISYPAEIKIVIYTTNAIESVNSQLLNITNIANSIKTIFWNLFIFLNHCFILFITLIPN